MSDAQTMYSDRVGWYVRGRPSYPDEVLAVLPGGPPPAAAMVADIASGTGLLAEVSLRNGNRVRAVEPDPVMLAAAQERFAADPRFTGALGTAESTGLPDASVDLITVGQALHWFDLPAARAEFRRVLRPGGRVLLAWNEQVPAAPGLQADVDALLRRALPGYAEAADAASSVTELATSFFGRPVESKVLANRQFLDETALLGRVLSNSYAPAREDPGWTRLADGLRALYARHAEDGRVHIDYDTWVFQGVLEGDPDAGH
jgi:SAM-dependent methyltransferase